MKNKKLIELTNVTKSFQLASGLFQALKNVTLGIEKGKLIAVTGKSGQRAFEVTN